MESKEKKFWIEIVKNNKGFMVMQIFLLFVLSGGGVFGAYLYMKIVDALTELSFKKSIIICLIYIGVNIVELIIDYFISLVSKITSNSVDIYIKSTLFNNILSQKGKKIVFTDSSEYTTLLLSDASKVSEVINGLFMPSLLNIIKAVGLIVFLAIVEWKLLVVALVIQPIIMILQKRAKTVLEKNANDGREATLQFFTAIKEYTSHLFEIIMLRKNDYFFGFFQKKLITQKKYEKKITMIEAKNDAVIEFFIMLSTIIIIALGGYEVCKGRITIGALMLYVQYYSGLLAPFGVVFQNIFEYASIRPSLRKVIQFWNDETTSKGKKADGTIISCEHVSFSYDEKEVLRDINVKLKMGNSYGIFGESGSGKSTFCKLLVGFWEPTKGKILYGKTKYSEIDKNELFNQVCYVSQDGYLFNDTIYNNIVLGQKCDKDEFNEILKKVNLTEFVDSLPMKENTIVGDNGAMVSGGQKKRIVLARALLNKSPIVILDEPTTGLDEKNAKEVVVNLLDEFSSSLVVVISHQMEIIELCKTRFSLHNKKMEIV
ncbi:MAG: ABC transporter ATP-binding protein [Lachnospiraceae bacterium]|nr:ABC transporter ATP-binding protein [Lachnospiraceae bacterium]